ncbi:V-type ATP synthase subunit I [Candidatus Omnitrophota bacterium]
MKKATILMQSKDSASAIENLGTLGLLHVEHQRLPQGEDIAAAKEEINLVNAAIQILSQEEFVGRANLQPTDELRDWKFTAHHLIDSRNRLSQLKDYATTLKDKISQYQAWGDFDPEQVRALTGQDIYIKLYQIPSKEIKKLASRFIVKKIAAVKDLVSCALIARKDFTLDFRQIPLPKMGLKKMRDKLSEDARAIEVIKGEMRKIASLRMEFLRVRAGLEEKLEFQQALQGMGEAGTIMYLSGYIPDDALKALEQTARARNWGIKIDDPSPEDKVPTLIRNPRWVSIINPVLKFLAIIPGYKELDISLWFLVFFSIFFGMLIGDAGIGLVFLSLTFFARRKWGNKLQDKSVFTLFYISSFCALIWGALTGTFFGQAWLPQSVKPLLPALRQEKNIQTICFFIGALHLSIAHAWRAVIKLPSFSALAELGWILILWGAFFLAKMLVLGDLFPDPGKWFFLVGAALVVLFASPNRNPFKGVAAGLGNLLLNFVNSFTDVVSYVRLFAVGLATVAVADAFNNMALDVGFDTILGAVLTSLILLLGHTLNILLAPMSILVHGVRLNVLEFSGHLDMQWQGFAYKPLRKSDK